MTKEQLKAKLSAIDAEYNKAKIAAYKKYAFANNPYKVGDLITDHVATIKIETIKCYVSFGDPSCVYTGTQYNKDGKVNKKQDHNTIYQVNIITN